jgi:negative regulator of flagellin synthesis FlgM
MKIDNTIKTPSTVSSDSKARATRESASSASSASETKVEISSLSGRLQQLEQAIGQAPVVDSGKVSEIKQAITSGQFKVNPEKVADGLIDSVRQMLAAQPRTA